ncbi:acyl-CoA dehydrogenase family protein [Goodfellowiella coeruleoviolacea]|uniref:Acyl-CoA dehydrogenase n=1 Tax=Goodfellowiella coeruleoviolacea TaxID=334858 RepID=A0AAE3KGV4_9PSEU|nr:acyl-CoA dehydrogenase family protein [Goodfellowiella coeruleoviolacea]MCP2167661.1 acyl-CoA dehydrogenase [Goodfellowiella coeruleoviolacea]
MLDLSTLVALAEADADGWDSDAGLPDEVIRLAARLGVFGIDQPTEYGGLGLGPGELGAAAARLGGVCTALRSLLTVTGVVTAAIQRWGTAEQRATWLPRLIAGEAVAGFAVTEPGAGSDLSAVCTRIEPGPGGHRVHGRKLWITFGQAADVLLVLGRAPNGPVAALVETDRPGVVVEPVRGQLGLRGCRLAHVSFEGVHLPADRLVAPAGFGLSHVASTALDHGRFTVAWGCVGMARACLADMTAHVSTRRQGDVALADHQSVRTRLGQAHAEVEGAWALCERAARERASQSPGRIMATVLAKYAAGRAAASVSQRAVQALGAVGCAPGSRVARFFRDAKVMQIIEGADEVAEVVLGDHVLAAHHGSRADRE